MSKKLSVCAGKSCKKVNSTKQLKKWGEALKDEGLINKVKKVKCLGTCKKAFALKYKGEVYSCFSKEEMVEVIAEKGKKK